MHVCLVCNQIAAFGKIGGFGSMARMIGRGLVERGVQVTVVCRRRAGQKRQERLDGMCVLGMGPWQTLISSAVFGAVGADVYHSQEPTIGTHLAQKAAPRARHVVTCIDPRDDSDWQVESRHSTWKRRLILPLQRYYEDGSKVREAVRCADQVCCQARFIAPKVKKKYGLEQEPMFMPNPIRVPHEPPAKADRPTCCYVCRFDPRKRPEIFFECVADNPEVRFIAVGKAHDAAYDSRLRKAYGALPNLELKGFLDPFADDTLDGIYAESWILANTAAREGLPATFLEACAQACALLAEADPDEMASRFGEQVHDGDFSGGLRRLLEGARWRDLGLKGYDYVKSTFERSRVIDLHIGLYERLLSSEPKDRS